MLALRITPGAGPALRTCPADTLKRCALFQVADWSTVELRELLDEIDLVVAHFAPSNSENSAPAPACLSSFVSVHTSLDCVTEAAVAFPRYGANTMLLGLNRAAFVARHGEGVVGSVLPPVPAPSTAAGGSRGNPSLPRCARPGQASK